MQDWVKGLGIKRDKRWAAAMAMVAMIETRDLVNYDGSGRISKDRHVSQSAMSAFIEDLVPGKPCRSLAADAAAGQEVLPLPLPPYECPGRQPCLCDLKPSTCSLNGRTCPGGASGQPCARN